MMRTVQFATLLLLVLGSMSSVEAQEDGARTDINTATAKALMVVPGIGKKTAARILEYREENGSFESMHELRKIKGVGKRTLEKLACYFYAPAGPLPCLGRDGPTGSSGKVNINTASAKELTKLPNIGVKKAAKIIKERELNGPYRSVYDLQRVKGIGKKTVETLLPLATVERTVTGQPRERIPEQVEHHDSGPANIAPTGTGTPTFDRKSAAESADQLQQQYEKVLLLRKRPNRNLTGIPAKTFQFLTQAVEQKRFAIGTGGPNSGETLGWCTRGASDAQARAGNVDNKGEARVTMQALVKRCSEVAQYTFDAKHQCKRTKKGWQCNVSLQIEITKYVASATGQGAVRLRVDRTFGKMGTMTIGASGSGSDQKHKERAIEAAAFVAKLMGERKVRNVPMFQIRAPVTRHREKKTYHCIPDDVGELDMPMHVLKRTSRGVERVGFVKCRKYYDGCTLTPTLKEQQEKGKKVTLRPSWAQDILGSSEIKPGMTVWEMPSVGLNVGLGAGINQIVGGSVSGALQITGEYNLARHVGISELHASIHLRGTYFGGDAARDLNKQFDKAYGIGPADSHTGGTASQAEMGVTKRWYMDSPLFFDLGLYLAGSYYQLAQYETASKTFDLGVQASGVGAKAGMGFQLAPRWILRLLAGYRVAYTFPSVKDDSGKDYVPSGGVDHDAFGYEAGFLVTIDLLYNI